MLPFCGYNMGDYMGHWLEIGEQADPAKLPRLYYVNWFRKDDDGKWLWPGFGENSRVLKWIVDRLEGRAEGVRSPIGVLPAPGELDLDGLDVPQRDLDLLLSVDADVWSEEASLMPEYFAQFGDRLPAAITQEHAALVERLEAARGTS
jgi:phosphoenolpyruvate carboxykinase (GTP)